jgi:hypothetical protein
MFQLISDIPITHHAAAARQALADRERAAAAEVWLFWMRRVNRNQEPFIANELCLF